MSICTGTWLLFDIAYGELKRRVELVVTMKIRRNWCIILLESLNEPNGKEKELKGWRVSNYTILEWWFICYVLVQQYENCCICSSYKGYGDAYQDNILIIISIYCILFL